jgi:hypothetical protein
VKVVVIFVIADYLLNKAGFYNQSLLLIFSIFAAFSFNPVYLLMMGLNYALSVFMAGLQIGDFTLMFLYLFSVLLNTFLMIFFLRIKYGFKEVE